MKVNKEYTFKSFIKELSQKTKKLVITREFINYNSYTTNITNNIDIRFYKFNNIDKIKKLIKKDTDHNKMPFHYCNYKYNKKKKRLRIYLEYIDACKINLITIYNIGKKKSNILIEYLKTRSSIKESLIKQYSNLH